MKSGTCFFSLIACLFYQLNWVSLCQQAFSSGKRRKAGRELWWGGSSNGVKSFQRKHGTNNICVCEWSWKIPSDKGSMMERKGNAEATEWQNIHVINRVIRVERCHHLTLHLQQWIHNSIMTNVTWDYFTRADQHCGAWYWLRWFTYCHAFCFTGRLVDEQNSRSRLLY